MPVTIDGSGATAGTHDFEVTIPADWDDFWDNIRSDGNDIVLTDADGKSILNFQFKSGFNLPNRSLTLQAENINLGFTGTFRPIGTVPTSIFQKDPDDQIDIWFPVGTRLAKRRIEYNQRLDFKLVQRASIEVKNSSKVNQVSMYALEELRVINGWCRLRIKAGADATDYSVRLGMVTTDAEVIVMSCLLQVRELTAQ